MKSLLSLPVLIVSFVAIGITTALVLLINPNELLVAIVSVVTLYVITSVTMYIRTTGYSYMDRVNLLLIAPVGLAYSVIIYVSSVIGLLIMSPLGYFKNKLTSLRRSILPKQSQIK